MQGGWWIIIVFSSIIFVIVNDYDYLYSRCRVDGGWTKSHSFVEPAMVQSLLVAKSFKGAAIQTNHIRKVVFQTSIHRMQCDSFPPVSSISPVYSVSPFSSCE